MARIKLFLNSSEVFDINCRVDISFNGVKVGTNVLLESATSELEYDVESISTSTENIIKIDLLNQQAYDADNNGSFDDEGDKKMTVTVSLAEYLIDDSTDDSTYTVIIPQTQSTFTIPSGANTGTRIELKPAVDKFEVFGPNHLIKFTTANGLANNLLDQNQPLNPVTTIVDGNKIAFADGIINDFDGNTVS